MDGPGGAAGGGGGPQGTLTHHATVIVVVAVTTVIVDHVLRAGDGGVAVGQPLQRLRFDRHFILVVGFGVGGAVVVMRIFGVGEGQVGRLLGVVRGLDVHVFVLVVGARGVPVFP